MSICDGSHIANISSTPKVRYTRDDLAAKFSQTANMKRRPRKPRLDDYERYRASSGWWLAAWRDHVGLTLEDLAAEVGTSKGVVSDLETGAVKSNGTRAQRFNRDTIEAMAKALDVPQGWLFDINPWSSDPRWINVGRQFAGLDDPAKQAVLSLVEHLSAAKAG